MASDCHHCYSPVYIELVGGIPVVLKTVKGIMQKKLLVILVLIVASSSSACTVSTPNYNDANQDIREESADTSISALMTNDADRELVNIVRCLEEVEFLSSTVFECFENYDTLNRDEQYSIIKKAEDYVSQTNECYEEIISICGTDINYENLSYQVKLLKHLIPRPISNNSESIDNAKLLYQLYFQQLSSSFLFFLKI